MQQSSSVGNKNLCPLLTLAVQVFSTFTTDFVSKVYSCLTYTDPDFIDSVSTSDSKCLYTVYTHTRSEGGPIELKGGQTMVDLHTKRSILFWVYKDEGGKVWSRARPCALLFGPADRPRDRWTSLSPLGSRNKRSGKTLFHTRTPAGKLLNSSVNPNGPIYRHIVQVKI